MSTSSAQLTALSRLFSSGVIRELAYRGQSSAFVQLFHKADIALRTTARVRDAFDAAFDKLSQNGFRDEYVYKTALTQNILLGTHSLKTASMLTEFRTGECKADVVILNGTTTVYEIKSDRDSLTRLANQVESYRKVFAKVFVIAGENHVKSVLENTHSDVGVVALSKRARIETIREAQNVPERICPVSVFETLRTAEAKSVLEMNGVRVEAYPNTRMRGELRKAFAQLSSKQAHLGMLAVLKKARSLQSLEDFVSMLPNSLQAAALTVPIRKGDQFNFVTAVNTPLRRAFAWT